VAEKKVKGKKRKKKNSEKIRKGEGRDFCNETKNGLLHETTMRQVEKLAVRQEEEKKEGSER